MPTTLLVVLALVALDPPARGQEPLGLRVPAGFEVVEFAGSSLANDIYRMTLDPRGRVVVAGRGYIRTLVDDDGDGRADRAIEFADGPRDGAMGMLWEGDTLYVTGDGGLRRYFDRNGDALADGPSELMRAMKTGGEHAAHAIRRGPDGWLYVICGNFTGIDATYASLPTSPIREPIAGCVLRFAPDLHGSEVVADGFRNAYGMDFNLDGELFAFDSDNERCVSLPWYEPTRFYHVVAGGHHGWRAPQRSEFWRLPPYDPDVARPLVTLGRGSPTGVACYRHTAFPPHYRGGFFLLDWTFGKVHFVALERSGASYSAHPEVFLESVGTNGFAPTDVVIHPKTGDLYVAVGGRGTRGAVYRVRYPGARPSAESPLPRRSLDWDPGLRERWLEQVSGGDAPARLDALIALRRHRARLSVDDVRAAVLARWADSDTTVRRVAAELIAELDPEPRRALASRARGQRARATYSLGVSASDAEAALDAAIPVVEDSTSAEPEARLTAVRAAQRALGDLTEPRLRGTVWEGYTAPRERQQPSTAPSSARLRAALRRAFPSTSADLDRELARTLAMLEDDDPSTLEKVAARLTTDSTAADDAHYLIVLARLGAPRPATVTARSARAILALDRKLDAQGATRDRFWPLRMAELHAGLVRKDPSFDAALLDDAEFGRTDHAVFALAPGFDRARAAEVFAARAATSSWTPDVVELIGALPRARAFPLLRALSGRADLDDSVLTILSGHPEEADRARYIAGLASPRWETVRRCLDALAALPRPKHTDDLMVALVRALGRIPDGNEGRAMRVRLGDALRRIAGADTPGPDRKAWAEWLATTRPDLAATVGADVDLGRWRSRLARVDWSKGNRDGGRQVFVRTGCANCHSGGKALGPDLRGVALRFSREDLFTAIVQPSRDVPARYRATLVATRDGEVYQGIVVYEAVDGIILQTGAATTVRLSSAQIESRRDAEGSIMPAGLLDPLSDQEIADLDAYLRSLGVAG